ncbi:MAG: hypothetical protein CSA96_03430 [Bacteroidetes bacterium]|nr:MAG: hypothetical protein CSA96_03430 [Bacteroidota bacterium]
MPQANRLNPALQEDYTQLILSASAFACFENSSLTINDLLSSRTENGHTTLYWDFEAIDARLREQNYLKFGAGSTPLYLGLRINNAWYLNFSASIVNSSLFLFPGSIAELRYGNADVETEEPRTIDLNHYDLNELSYASYSFGTVIKPNPDLRMGLRAKALMGLSAIVTNTFLATIETSDDFSSSLLKTDISMNVSGTLFETDRIRKVFRPVTAFSDFFLGKDAVSNRNTGLALDFGFSWRPGRIWSLEGAINDLGYIHWRKDPQQLVSKGEYLYEGLQFSPYTLTDEEFKFDDYLQRYADTILTTIIPEAESKSFSTPLNTRVYLGSSCKLSRKLSIHALYHARHYAHATLRQGTFSASWTPLKAISLSGSFSYSNYWWNNLGLALILRSDWIEIYFASDNLNTFWNPRDSRGINISLGTNLILWKRNPGNPLTE